MRFNSAFKGLKTQGEGSYQKLSHNSYVAVLVAAILCLNLCPKSSPVALLGTIFLNMQFGCSGVVRQFHKIVKKKH
jgi:hypothetical protein